MNKKTYLMHTPLGLKEIKKLKAGDFVKLSGNILGARDAAHKRMIAAIKDKKTLPVELKDQVIFYMGPSPAPPGKASGSLGPTTSARMDEFTPYLLEKGLSAAIGKGPRSERIKKSFQAHRAIYFVTYGGVAAYLASKVKNIQAIAYNDLGPEAIYELEVKDLPVIVAYDIYGGDIFKLDG